VGIEGCGGLAEDGRREEQGARMDAKLSVLNGPTAGQTIQVPRGKLLIGRAEDCDLRPASEVVSGYHCVLLLDDYTLRVRDLASKNGTRVNGRRIGAGSTILVHDDVVSVGDLQLRIDLTQATAQFEPADSGTQLPVSPSALEKTGLIDGDTLQDKISGATALPVSPKFVSPPVSPEPPLAE
jgi:pSer/pThr/pTyr-binding forkhead associated (FHA) protein